jgi:hypothetical protein
MVVHLGAFDFFASRACYEAIAVLDGSRKGNRHGSCRLLRFADDICLAVYYGALIVGGSFSSFQTPFGNALVGAILLLQSAWDIRFLSSR